MAQQNHWSCCWHDCWSANGCGVVGATRWTCGCRSWLVPESCREIWGWCYTIAEAFPLGPRTCCFSEEGQQAKATRAEASTPGDRWHCTLQVNAIQEHSWIWKIWNFFWWPASIQCGQLQRRHCHFAGDHHGNNDHTTWILVADHAACRAAWTMHWRQWRLAVAQCQSRIENFGNLGSLLCPSDPWRWRVPLSQFRDGPAIASWRESACARGQRCPSCSPPRRPREIQQALRAGLHGRCGQYGGHLLTSGTGTRDCLGFFETFHLGKVLGVHVETTFVCDHVERRPVCWEFEVGCVRLHRRWQEGQADLVRGPAMGHGPVPRATHWLSLWLVGAKAHPLEARMKKKQFDRRCPCHCRPDIIKTSMMISMQHVQMGIYSMHAYIHTYIIIHPQGVSYPPPSHGGGWEHGTRDHIYEQSRNLEQSHRLKENYVHALVWHIFPRGHRYLERSHRLPRVFTISSHRCPSITC